MWEWAMTYPLGFFLLSFTLILAIGITIESVIKAFLMMKGVYVAPTPSQNAEDE